MFSSAGYFGHPRPPNDNVLVVQANPLQRGTLLAATGRALLFRSRDAGDTWTPLPFPAESRASLHAVMMDPARPSVYLVAVSSETPRYAGVFRTRDAGVSWEQLQDLKEKQVGRWRPTRGTDAGWPPAPRMAFTRRATGAIPGHAYRPAGPRPVVTLTFDPLDSRTLYAGTPHLA
jgi:hypothetical protein